MINSENMPYKSEMKELKKELLNNGIFMRTKFSFNIHNTFYYIGNER